MANERSRFVVVQEVEPISRANFMILETAMTSDGFRTRVCDGHWRTFEEAEADRQRRMYGRS